MALYKLLCTATMMLILLSKGCHPQLSVCGQAPLNTKIVGGQNSTVGAWPWQASLHRFGSHFCGGSLINKEWVLTAAHCFPSTSMSGFIVYLGRQTQKGFNRNEVNRTITQIICHPNYEDSTHDNDICLLKLSSPVNFTNYVRPVCLAASNSSFHNGTASWLTGWGDISSGEPLPSPQTLQEVEVPVVGNRQCNCFYGGGSITENMICAGLTAGGKDTCQGDSGGPMVSKQDNLWVLSGVVSFGIGCAQPNYPGVYARVSLFQSWINSHIPDSEKPGFVIFTSPGIDGDLNAICGLPVNTSSNITSAAVCGQAPLNTKIVGGQNSTVGAWPWQASLHRFGSHFCGGSLINKEWVLTAAHCFPRSNLSAFAARKEYSKDLCRDLTQKGFNRNEVNRTITQIICHPNYEDSTHDNDICLLKLSSPVNFTNYVRPVCLAASNSSFHNGTASWLTGWGDISSGEPLPSPQTLQEVEVPVVGNRQCNCFYGGGSITENMICAGLTAGGKDTCQGDSGGPMVSKQDNLWVLSGVVSFGIGCAQPNYPGVYARVSLFQSWINSHIPDSEKPGFVIFTSPGIDGDLNAICGLPVNTSSNITSAAVCGLAPLNTKIAGGQNASSGSWPWHALLYRFDEFCGGSLINKEWVVTDARCCQGGGTFGVVVYLGSKDQQGPNPNQVSRTVAQIIIHPKFSSNTFDNDICLVKLSFPVTFTDYIRPVCLAASNSSFHNGTDSWITGFGRLSNGHFPQTLQEVNVPVVGNRQCNCIYGVGYITDNMMCAASPGKGSCLGDIGGPLVSKQDNRWILSGVGSLSAVCFYPDFPGVYARVSKYQSWINSTITSDQPRFITFTSTGTDGDLSVSCETSPNTSSNTPSVEVCGLAPLNTRIVGGQNAILGSWPWQASLQKAGSHYCGAILLNQDWVLTAAHCLIGSHFGVKVNLGLKTLEGSNPNRVSVVPAEIIIHPDYNPDSFDNDIGLMRLSSPVAFTDYVRPVCLAAPDSTFHNETDSWLTGWGTIQLGVPLPPPGNLQEVNLPIVGNKQCNCSYKGIIHITDNMICVGIAAGGKGACHGDSGGPMVSKQGKRWILSGVTSFGAPCAVPNFPSVYTRVSKFQSWIKSHIKTDPPGFLSFTSAGIDGDLSFTCDAPPPLTTTPAPPPAPSNPVVCGNAPLSSRIGGGSTLATPGLWPWMASLHKNGIFICGGTLVAEQYVMSDADCFFSQPNPSEWTVVLGRLKQNGSNPFEVKLKVGKLTLSNTTGSNVAVLKLVNKPTLTDHIQPICVDLGGTTFNTGTTCWVAGWSAGHGGVEQILHEMQTSVVDCGTSASADNICTVALDLQQSDAGGPLMCKQAGAWIEAAVLTVDRSNTTLSGKAGQAISIFQKTSRHVTFLRSTVGTFPPSASGNATTATTTTTTTTTTTGSANMIHFSLFTLLFSLIPYVLLFCAMAGEA